MEESNEIKESKAKQLNDLMDFPLGLWQRKCYKEHLENPNKKNPNYQQDMLKFNLSLERMIREGKINLDFDGMIKKIEHIGIAVKNLESSNQLFEKLLFLQIMNLI